MKFLTTCVGCHGNDLALLNEMIATGVKITRQTFLKHVDRDSLRDLEVSLGYETHASRGLTMAADWHVAYYKGWWGDVRCVYLVWSAIEHIFI